MSLGFTFHFPGYFPNFRTLPLASNIETNYLPLTIYPVFYKHNVVEWSAPDFWGNCSFDIYRSETEYGPWEKLNPTPVTGNHFKDATTQDFSKFQNGFYTVECLLPSGQRIKSAATTWQNKRTGWADLRAIEIRRRESLLLSKFTGIKTFIFRRRNFGKRCPECWNFETEQVTKDHCSTCLGTSFEGGYFNGFETLVQYDPTTNDAVLSYQGKVEQNQIPAWTIDYPEISIFDLILRVPDWKLYRVDRVFGTELQAVVVRQSMLLTELAKESIEFKLAEQALPQGYSQ